MDPASVAGACYDTASMERVLFKLSGPPAASLLSPLSTLVAQAMYGKYRLGLEAAQIAVGEYYSIDGWTIGQVDYVAELITVGT